MRIWYGSRTVLLCENRWSSAWLLWVGGLVPIRRLHSQPTYWYDTGVTGFICKCAEDSIPAKSIRVLPNQETMNREIHYILKFKPEGFMLSDPNLHRKSRYNLHCTIRDVKRQFKIKNMLHLERGWGQAESLVTARSPSMRSILCLFLAGLWNYIALPTASGASMVPVTDVRSAVTWMNRARN